MPWLKTGLNGWPAPARLPNRSEPDETPKDHRNPIEPFVMVRAALHEAEPIGFCP
jgi:hypothetical protein